MFPVLFSIGPLTLHTYGVLLALGAALGLWLLTHLAKKQGLDPDRVMSLSLWLLISGLVGSRLLFVLLEPAQFKSAPWRVLAIWEGGLVFYGGVAAALVVGLILMRRWRLPVLTLLDCAAPALALGQALGRFGCFSAGCCYGRVWEGGWCAVTFSDPLTLAPGICPCTPPSSTPRARCSSFWECSCCSGATGVSRGRFSSPMGSCTASPGL